MQKPDFTLEELAAIAIAAGMLKDIAPSDIRILLNSVFQKISDFDDANPDAFERKI